MGSQSTGHLRVGDRSSATAALTAVPCYAARRPLPGAGLGFGMKVPRPLQPLIDDGIIDSVVRRLRSGKEAAVFIVDCAGELRCAKVYKEDRKSTRLNSSHITI